eukprot:TRINITY_DN2385_c0_g1_i1.p1 TRINITY_DN2385_c0_g1~~TRINITY_DN2385_c0_g1_i1.p1  ORF type:complete len:233 (-),score=32.31 TRINITY_DN2385_c0_g1_i1:131-829(-)
MEAGSASLPESSILPAQREEPGLLPGSSRILPAQCEGPGPLPGSSIILPAQSEAPGLLPGSLRILPAQREEPAPLPGSSIILPAQSEAPGLLPGSLRIFPAQREVPAPLPGSSEESVLRDQLKTYQERKARRKEKKAKRASEAQQRRENFDNELSRPYTEERATQEFAVAVELLEDGPRRSLRRSFSHESVTSLSSGVSCLSASSVPGRAAILREQPAALAAQCVVAGGLVG